MSTNRYAAAGWAAILSAAGTLAVLGLSFAFDLSKIAGRPERFTPALWSLQQIVLVIAVDALAWILGIYALVKFRDLLRERYDFHAIDHLIWIVIGAGLLVAAASYAQRLAADGKLGSALVGVATMVVLGVLNGVIGIVFATRLLKINGNLNGYKKPLAYVYLAGSICFLLVVPALVGMVLLAAWSVLLGLSFFQGEELEELEVV
ncbi:MAG: hypothetical protein MUE47_06350 [Acidobacteria bacterium]|nr:hypothetical protein [Acidobacteriota bacterium]